MNAKELKDLYDTSFDKNVEQYSKDIEEAFYENLKNATEAGFKIPETVVLYERNLTFFETATKIVHALIQNEDLWECVKSQVVFDLSENGYVVDKIDTVIDINSWGSPVSNSHIKITLNLNESNLV